MTWSLAFPNLLVGLREGLEAGLVVTILIGAVRRLAPGRSLAAVWLGVAGAAVLSVSFGAVLTFSSAELSPRAQEIFGGVMSLISVVLVTSMIFWMRRTARAMSGDLRARVGTALAAGGTALVVTAFVAVAREGLEAALFVWTNAQAAGSSTSPLIGAVIGLTIAIGMCIGLYRRVLKVNLTRFFTVTGAVLVVIVAGVLAYGITDLQDANVLPGVDSIAFDVSSQVPTGRWWSELIRGVTNLNNRMAWLPVVAYVGYIAVVMTLFLRPERRTEPVAPAAAETPAAGPSSRRRLVTVSVALLAVPAIAAAAWVIIDHQRLGSVAGAQTVTLTNTACASDWSTPTVGSTTYSVRNTATNAVDVELVSGASGAVVAEIEVLGPGTARALPVTLSNGSYRWKCLFSGAPMTISAERSATGTGSGSTPAVLALKPATASELAPVLVQYRGYVGRQLALLTSEVATLRRDIAAGDRATARRSWLTAHLTYHRIGAAYDAFGAAGDAVDGLASGLPGGRTDPGFVGFHRIETLLWSTRPVRSAAGYADRLVTAVDALHAKLPGFTFDPNDVTIRAHEIIEDVVRFVLTGQSDYGSGSGFATARADLDGDRVLVDMLAPLLDERERTLVPTVHRDMALLDRQLTTAMRSGSSVADAPLRTRQDVDAATGQLAEDLAPIPEILQVKTV